MSLVNAFNLVPVVEQILPDRPKVEVSPSPFPSLMLTTYCPIRSVASLYGNTMCMWALSVDWSFIIRLKNIKHLFRRQSSSQKLKDASNLEQKRLGRRIAFLISDSIAAKACSPAVNSSCPQEAFGLSRWYGMVCSRMIC